MPPRLIIVATLCAAIIISALWPPRAVAGTYDVYSCRLPDGSPAEADGWVPRGAIALDTCWQSGGLQAELPPEPQMWERQSGWRFAAPADTSIATFTIYRYAETESTYP
jgi:hypothetical protein